MAMTPVTIPDLGETIERVRVLRWFVAAGDAVGEGDKLLEISTDKIDCVIEAPASGVVGEVAAGPGDVVPIGAQVAIIT
jgi:2-oxoglutarate dehydrogenase E2 component (dihydrolipoamide succinyltransferase)